MNVADVLFGRRLANEEEREQRVGPLAGIPLLGLDALSSAAYGPEAALTVLLPLGLAGLPLALPILAGILVLLAMVCFSYRQTIAAYPSGGGSYTVARENLGPSLGLLAGAALALDYMLNVAVGISAGVGAVVSAVPALEPHTLLLCLTVLALLTFINLRGVRDAGVAFFVPTYLFIGCLMLTFVVGIVKTLLTGGHPAPVVAPPHLPHATATASVWLIARAFSSGCTAMTGVEAVSNGVTMFKPPARRHAQRTLTAIVAILMVLLVGVGVLAVLYHVGATPPGTAGYQSILSQLLAAVVGRGPLYDLSIASIFAVLALSANTSFADFPRLAKVLAVDRYLPTAFANRGRRLVYSAGIVTLSALAAILLIAFGGVTDRLIPLFAIGAFLAFTLSQAGMVRHWRREGGPRAKHSQIINAVGAAATGLTLLVVLASKLVEGAWVSVVLLAGMMVLFERMHRHYAAIAAETERGLPLDVSGLARGKPPLVVVPIGKWSRVVNKALRFAVKLSPDVHAVQVLGAEADCRDLTGSWGELVEEPLRKVGITPPTLTVLPSSYRRLFEPLLRHVGWLSETHPDRDIAVVVPELVERKWYHTFLHTHRATMLKAILLMKGGPRIVIVNTPWYLRSG